MLKKIVTLLFVTGLFSVGYSQTPNASPTKTEVTTSPTQDVKVDPVVLQTYVGKYELVPGFILTVTRTGDQLKAQATGQQDFPVFPKAKNIFYYKVVEAQLTFNQTEGKVQSVTLKQNGQEIVGKKIE